MTIKALRGHSERAVAEAMQRLGIRTAVLASWGNASDAVLHVTQHGEGELEIRGTGKQVADYRHRSTEAASARRAGGVVDVHWHDGRGRGRGSGRWRCLVEHR